MFGYHFPSEFSEHIFEFQLGFHRLEEKSGKSCERTVTSFYKKWVGPSSDESMQDRLKKVPRNKRKEMETEMEELLSKTACRRGYKVRLCHYRHGSGWYPTPLKRKFD
jgi:hypothetical protein